MSNSPSVARRPSRTVPQRQRGDDVAEDDAVDAGGGRRSRRPSSVGPVEVRPSLAVVARRRRVGRRGGSIGFGPADQGHRGAPAAPDVDGAAPAGDVDLGRLEDVGRRRPQGRLDLERSQLGVLRLHERGEPGDVRCRERVPRRDRRPAIEPRDLHIDAACEELGGGLGVRVEAQRVVRGVARDAGDRREERGVADAGDVVGRRDDERIAEVGAIAHLVERQRPILLRRAQREVDDVETLLDGPREPGVERGGGPGERRPEHADARDRGLRGQRVDDAGARGSVAEHVAVGAGSGDHRPVVADRHVDAALGVDAPLERRMGGVDPAVDDGHPHPGAGGPFERPVRGDLDGRAQVTEPEDGRVAGPRRLRGRAHRSLPSSSSRTWATSR